VAQWFLAAPNTKFIEIFPEESFKIALALQLPDVLIASFKILVNEFAIDYAAEVRAPQRPMYTWSQRKRGEYGDLPQDPVEHAGIAFYERIKRSYDMLRSYDVFDRLGIREWQRLTQLGKLIEKLNERYPDEARELVKVYQTAVLVVNVCFQEMLDEALSQSAPDSTTHYGRFLEAQRRHYVPEHSLMPLEELYCHLNTYQKILCPFFWRNLFTSVASFSKRMYRLVKLETYWRLLSRQIQEEAALIEKLVQEPGCEELFRPGYNWEVNFGKFDLDLEITMKTMELDMLFRTDIIFDGLDGPPMYVSDHLIRRLGENELKFLPMWAGGWDDGSGGVFQEAVPPAEMGPSEPGPAYHTGWTIATDNASGVPTNSDTATVSDLGIRSLDLDSATVSDLGVGNLDIASTIAGDSLDAQDSHSTVTSQLRVLSDTQSLPSEQFSGSEAEFAEARIAEPAQHQAVGQALEVYAYVSDDAASQVSVVTASSSITNPFASPSDQDADIEIGLDEDSDDTLSAFSAGDADSDFEMV
jgi:hypothetical protein